MKLRNSIIGIIITTVIIFVLTLISNVNLKKDGDFYYIGSFDKETIDENYVFTNYDDYYDKFGSSVLDENDFKNSNYVLLPMKYDSCSESDLTPTNYVISGKNIDVTVEYKASCGLCAPKIIYYLLKVSKNMANVNVKINYKAINKPNCNPNISYKPIIYLYPNEEMNVHVKLGRPELLTTTYPKYNNGWNLTAYPNGILKNSDGKEFYGLYWEGINNIQSDFIDGFVVKREDTISFLEEKLSILGLNERESNEFIIYWLPKLEENKYNLIRFESIGVVNKQMPLYIDPKPDTIIRVFMEYKGINNNMYIAEQKLYSPKRRGFTAVEWGGSLIR